METNDYFYSVIFNNQIECFRFLSDQSLSLKKISYSFLFPWCLPEIRKSLKTETIWCSTIFLKSNFLFIFVSWDNHFWIYLYPSKIGWFSFINVSTLFLFVYVPYGTDEWWWWCKAGCCCCCWIIDIIARFWLNVWCGDCALSGESIFGELFP